MQSKEIRHQFIEFFKQKEHTVVPSAPVLPVGDATLLFTNAGMNQFKDIFLGKITPSYTRAVNSQKCIRVSGKHNDLEEVGKDTYHHTFFEMLGTWSFGDYYKKEAITWAWELLTDVWKLPKEQLYASVYQSDQEAFDLWQKETDIANGHVLYFGDQDNFWMMGETGPCGPCSEIHIDLGADRCDKKDVPGHICAVNSGCARFIELWNLVFIQFNKDEHGNLNELPKKYVDTGAGFERICAVLQNKRSNYDTDVFMPIIEKIAELSGVNYADDQSGTPHRAIADHIRMLTFAVSDGVLPSNEGRGYVLRRVLRRAVRYGRNLGFKEPFLSKLIEVIATVMGDTFPEILAKKEYAKKVILGEENSFYRTVDKGLAIFEELYQKTVAAKCSQIAGADVFKLYDTYGFPPDLTAQMAEEKGLAIDLAGFEQEMCKQKERARACSLGVDKGIGGEIVVNADNAEEAPAMARHHTATHLLHAALQQVLGTHATQAGSLVNPDKLRFDFNHFQALTTEELTQVEALVNAEISKGSSLKIVEKKYTEAVSDGAISLFGEKYGEIVRVVEIPGFSKELCGGHHVANTADLEAFKIVKESSISAGIRRIEALAGQAVIAAYLQEQTVAAAAEQEKEQQRLAAKQHQKELLEATMKKMSDFLSKKEEINGQSVLLLAIGEANQEILRTVANSAVNALGEAFVLLAGTDNGKVALLARVTPALITKELNAAQLVKVAAAKVGGCGGGKPDCAQAGGNDPSKISEALLAAKQLIAGG